MSFLNAHLGIKPKENDDPKKDGETTIREEPGTTTTRETPGKTTTRESPTETTIRKPARSFLDERLGIDQSSIDQEKLEMELLQFRESISGLSIEEKAKAKAEFLEKMYPYCDKIYGDGKNLPPPGNNQVLGWYIVFLFDVGLISEFLRYVNWAIYYSLPTLNEFTRNWRDFRDWSILGWANKEFLKDNSIQPYFDDNMKEIESFSSVELRKDYLHLKFKELYKIAKLVETEGDEEKTRQAKETARAIGITAYANNVSIKTDLNKLNKALGHPIVQ